MSRWSFYLVASLVIAGLGAAFAPSVIAAPKLPNRQTKPATVLPTNKGQVMGPVFSAKAKLNPKELSANVSSASPLKIRLTPTARLQEIVAERSQNAILARGIGARTVVSPRNMFIDKYTHMRVVGDVVVTPSAQSTGEITMLRKSEWRNTLGMTDLVALAFRASAEKHYVIDCLVSGDHTELYLAHNLDWIGSKATHEGDHRIALLPKASTHRNVTAFIFNETEYAEYSEVYQCEIIPLRE